MKRVTKIVMALNVLAGIIVLLSIVSWWAEVPDPADESYAESVFVAISATCLLGVSAIVVTAALLAVTYVRFELPRTQPEDEANRNDH